MNLQGTPGKTKVIQVDPNNQRLDLDTPSSSFAGGTFTQVTVDKYGRVTAGRNPNVSSSSSTPTVIFPTGSHVVEGKQGNYSGSVPDWTPSPGSIGIGIDTSNNRIWWYFGGAWQ